MHRGIGLANAETQAPRNVGRQRHERDRVARLGRAMRGLRERNGRTAHFQETLRFVPRFVLDVERLEDACRHVTAFQEAPHLEKVPHVAVRQRRVADAGKGLHRIANAAQERRGSFAQDRPQILAIGVEVEDVDHFPHFGREFRADAQRVRPCDAHRRHDRTAVLTIEGAVLETVRRDLFHASEHGLFDEPNTPHDRSPQPFEASRLERIEVHRTGVVYVRHAGDRLGTFDVTPEPEYRFRNAAQHALIPGVPTCLCCRRPARN